MGSGRAARVSILALAITAVAPRSRAETEEDPKAEASPAPPAEDAGDGASPEEDPGREPEQDEGSAGAERRKSASATDEGAAADSPDRGREPEQDEGSAGAERRKSAPAADEGAAADSPDRGREPGEDEGSAGAERRKSASAADEGAAADDPSSDPKASEDGGEEERPPVARDDEPLILLETDKILRIKSRRARLRASAYARLREIAVRYHEATEKKLIVTGGGRTPARQAELMHDMMRNGKDLLRLYIQVALVKPLIAVYEEGKKKRWGRRRTVAAMHKIIAAQVQEGRYVSRHLAHTAADVRSRGLKDVHVAALKAAVAEVKGARLVDERNGNAPHFHLSL